MRRTVIAVGLTAALLTAGFVGRVTAPRTLPSRVQPGFVYWVEKDANGTTNLYARPCDQVRDTEVCH